MPGCTTCSDGVTCTQCDSTLMLTVDSLNQCTCMTYYYMDGTCKVCLAAMVGCTECTSNTTCTVCNTTAGFTLVGETCVCPFGSYLDPFNTCSICDSSCETCFNKATNCLTCVAPKTISGSSCVCANGTYFSGSACLPCHSACSLCNGPAINDCTECANPYVLSGSTCICGSNAFLDASNICTLCHYSCSACNGSTANDCKSCNSTWNRVLLTNACPCDSTYSDVGVSHCQSGSCTKGYTFNSQTNICDEVCGDGLVFSA